MEEIIHQVNSDANTTNFMQIVDEAGLPINLELPTITTNAETTTEEHLKDLQNIQDWLTNPENKENALALALQIQDQVSKNWFSFDRFIKKSGELRESGWQKLQVLKAFGYLNERRGDYKDGKKLIRMQLFKIAITNEDKILCIDRTIEFYQDQIQQLESEKKQYL